MMKDTEALDILRAQGHTVGTPDIHTGRVSVWITSRPTIEKGAPGIPKAA